MRVRFDAGTAAAPIEVTLHLVGDEAGLPGDTVLDTLSVTAVTSIFAGGSVRTAASTTQPLLSPGLYWFCASTSVERAYAGWTANVADTRRLRFKRTA